MKNIETAFCTIKIHDEWIVQQNREKLNLISTQDSNCVITITSSQSQTKVYTNDMQRFIQRYIEEGIICDDVIISDWVGYRALPLKKTEWMLFYSRTILFITMSSQNNKYVNLCENIISNITPKL
jgi:hypothetical protein